MTSSSTPYDFIVIGCGPAGATIATQLSRKGYSVLVFEKAKFPRLHEGESLLPFCYPILKDLGVLDEMKKKYVRKPGARFSNYDGKSSATWFFKSVIHDDSHLSFNVDRASFDHILMKNAVKNGVTVMEETKVAAVDTSRPGELVEVQTMDVAGERETWQAKFLIDASGQETFMAKRAGAKNDFEDMDRIAWIGHWKGGRYMNGVEVGLINIIRMSAGKKGWFAIQPVGKDLLSLTMIVDRKYMRQQKKLLTDAGEEDWQHAFYVKEIADCAQLHEMLEHAYMIRRFAVISDYSYYSDIAYGDNYLLVGDSFKFLDPIFSTGVYLGMKSAELYAEALDVKFREGREAGDKKMAQALETIQGAYGLVEKFINIYYDPTSMNLAEVNPGAESGYKGYEKAYSLLHYLLAGDFFANYEKYSEFLDIIKDPARYKKWKSLIADKIQAAAVPSVTPEEVFGAIEADQ
ncbi:MAG: hypothetical protein BGO69_02910 [Bacteroidetes bacterium 46-16]|nr:MAG: hypothetical protein BGO69_02910 [Bacteroidetes bacterium 46-16]